MLPARSAGSMRCVISSSTKSTVISQPCTTVCTARGAAPQISPAHVVTCTGNLLVHPMCLNCAQATAATALLTISSNQAPPNAGKRTWGGCKAHMGAREYISHTWGRGTMYNWIDILRVWLDVSGQLACNVMPCTRTENIHALLLRSWLHDRLAA
jgi:hypothetical protein